MPDSDEPAQPDPLQPLLRDVEAQLRRRLHEACEAEANGVVNDSAAEIRRLEDSLLAAAVAAEQAVTLRRHIERRKAEDGARASPATGDASPPAADTDAASAIDEPADATLRVREFRDSTGQLWRAWPVTPGLARHSRTTERYLGEFHKGWICFESLEGPARRRLPQRPSHWTELADAELVELLGRAITAPQRKPHSHTPDTSPPTPMH